MPRRSAAANLDPFADLAKKAEILEREMAVQRAALERLKEIASTGAATPLPNRPARKSA